MLVQSSESTVLYNEYHKVFGRIGKESEQQLKLEKQAMKIMVEMRRMDAWAKKIQEEGKHDKIHNFNKRYIKLKMELAGIYEKSYGER